MSEISEFEISKFSSSEIENIKIIYQNARKFMKDNGNHNQWGDFYPSDEVINEDIKNGHLYVVSMGEKIIGVFSFFIGEDPTYKKIYGKWKSNEPYGVIHRIASSFEYKGLMEKVVSWCFNQIGSIRIDTHFRNKPMRRALKKLGFKYCGLIYCRNQTLRLAYQKIKFKVK